MDAQQLRTQCLALAGAFEDFPFGPETAVFKVRAADGKAKMFALSSLDERALSVSLKCEPDLAVQLRAAHPEVTGAYHLNKKHWNGVVCNGALQEGMIADMIEDSYDLVVASLPRRDREILGWKRLAQE
ncbi:MmcQ/YjbR family DNA-binding protein [Arthrobacter roseus]|uniref:MmcQ/YjbR family DNA-binding protein n=1 Tax=Arthrobacter roseus TaxID=136274 RepID=UPI0019668034|nr:putative DNA-binding protein (MmcQ/YjbR family) [Arthrobacter roseus]